MTKPKEKIPAILVCTNKESGRILGVGLFASEADAKRAARGATATDVLISIWTPQMDGYVTSCSYPFGT